MIRRLHSHYLATLKQSLLRANHSYDHYIKMKSNYQTKATVAMTRELLQKKYQSLICESNSVMTVSYHQIHQISSDIHSLAEILRQEPRYNFSSASTIHFFPPDIVSYFEIFTMTAVTMTGDHLAEEAEAETEAKAKANTMSSRKKVMKKKSQKKKKIKKKKKLSHQPGGGGGGGGGGGTSDSEGDEILGYSDSGDEQKRHQERQRQGQGQHSPFRLLNKECQPQTPPHRHKPPQPPLPNPQTDVFELTASEEKQFGHLKEFILHSDSEVSSQQETQQQQQQQQIPSFGEDGYADQLLEHEIQEDTDLYRLEFDSDDEDDNGDGDGDGDGDEEPQQEHHVTFALPAGNKNHSTKRKKKKLLRWNPEPCSECQRSFRGEGKIIPTLLRSASAIATATAKEGGVSDNDQRASSPKSRPLSAHCGSTDFLRQKVISSRHSSHPQPHQQHPLRELYGNRRGMGKIFCSWKCALRWNEQHTSMLHRYHTEKLIKIAAKKINLQS